MIAARVLADATAYLVGQVEAHLTEGDLLLHLANRLREPDGVLGGGAQNVEGEPLGGARADPGELRQLGHEPLDRRSVAAHAIGPVGPARAEVPVHRGRVHRWWRRACSPPAPEQSAAPR